MVKLIREIDLYEKLLSKNKEGILLGNILGCLNWDMETYMPSKGVEQRSEEMSILSGLLHDKNTDPEIGSLLAEIKAHKDYSKLTPEQKRNIYLIQLSYDRATKIPKDLVVEFTKQVAIATNVWRKARKESNFELFKPELEKILEFSKKQAHFLDPTKDPLDVWIDIYEPGFSMKIIDKLFSELRDGLIPIITACVKTPNQPAHSLIERECPKEVQKEISKDLMKLIKYNTDGGRLDETTHPFSTGYFDDVRITTRYSVNDFADNFFSVMHEGGHALYEQNYPQKYKYQPIGAGSSGGIHESQSRFIENIIGRSREFWEFYFPRLNKLTNNIFADISFDKFVHAINLVRPSKIRVDADPITYSLHVIIRYEIEKDLFAGKLAVADLPKVWNEKMKNYIGITIDNDAEGVLQDIHWSNGLFGYFPDYALGNLYDGQLLWKMEQDIPDWRTQMKKGDLSKIIKWLIDNVHQKGNLYNPLDLIKEITGKELSSKFYLDYLRKEYSKYYNL